jgi:predicted  nucleic acid-binding Zn-ribbon protein
MKLKIGIVVLAVVAAGLLIALLADKKEAEELHKKDADAILDISNQLTTANASLDDLRQVNLALTNDIVAGHEALETASNNLAETATVLADARAALENAQGEITNLNVRVSDLQAENRVLDDRANMLSNTIAALNIQIANTQQKLATSETNNVFLAGELQKQMEQKAELERQFNDLDVVRAQVKKLRDQEFSARRLEWINDGTSPGNQAKGAQLLMQRPPPATKPAAVHASQYNLNVEVGSDGSVHVIPPPASPQDTAAQSAARAALLKQIGDTNATPSGAPH